MITTILATLLLSTPVATTGSSAPQTEYAAQAHKKIHAEELQAWYKDNKEMIVIDARSKQYFNGTLLPNAKWLSSESTEAEILTAVPNKESVIVVYCAGVKCPASGSLVTTLNKMGYSNVYEYSEGLEDWMQKGFATIQE